MSNGTLFHLCRVGRRCLTPATIRTSRGFLGPPGRWDPFSEVTHAIRDIEKKTARMERDMDKFWSRTGIDRYLPSFSRLSPIGTSDGVHRITMDLHGYKPENVKISLKDRVVTVEGKYEHEDEGTKIYQEWTRRYNLPERADLEKVKSLLDNDGILTIEAPSVKSECDTAEAATEIPIEKN